MIQDNNTRQLYNIKNTNNMNYTTVIVTHLKYTHMHTHTQ